MADLATTRRRSRVLVVDDEEDVRHSLRQYLESMDADVAVAQCGTDAVAMMERDDFDLIIADYKLPDMTGIDVLDRAKTLLPTAMRVLITAYADLNVAVRGINEAGVAYFFPKPFDIDEMGRVMRSLLHEAQLGDQVLQLTERLETAGKTVEDTVKNLREQKKEAKKGAP